MWIIGDDIVRASLLILTLHLFQRPKKLNVKSPKEFLRIKVVMLGEGGVGKSCIASKYCENKFEDKYEPTIAVDYKNKVVDN